MTDYKIEIRPMDAKLFCDFYKTSPNKTGFGFCYCLNDIVLGCVFAFKEKGFYLMCSDLIESDIVTSIGKITKFKLAKLMLEKFKNLESPVYATSMKSGKFLERLGFDYIADKDGFSFYLLRG